MANSKTPVMVLQEYCMQNKIQVPFYEDLPEEITDGGVKKIFNVRVSAVNKSSIGKGSNKKNAKHAAAAFLLQQLGQKVSFCPEVVIDEQQSPITALLDLCIQRNMRLAEFEEVQASGPSHCPKFTIRCRIATLSREAEAPTKKQAKAKAATMMLQVIQEVSLT